MTVRRTVPLHVKILIGLLVGATLGLSANAYGLYLLSQEPIAQAVSEKVALPAVADVEKSKPGEPTPPPKAETAPRNPTLVALDTVSRIADVVGQIFLRLVFMVVIPLVFSALALGVAGMRDMGQLGRVGLKTFCYTVILSTCAVLIGVGLTNALQPGSWLSEKEQQKLSEKYTDVASQNVAKAKQAKTLDVILLDIIPKNPLQEMVGALDGSSPGGGMLAVMFFSLMFGLALTRVPENSEILVGWLEGLQAVSMVIIGWAMRMAPVAVACLVFSLTSRLGLAILPPLLGFMGTVLLGLGLQMFVVYPVLLWWVTGRNPWRFFSQISEAIWTAFGTSSSNASLPTALRVAREELLLPDEEARFVLTIGATGNQNGTALYEGVVVLFLAQVFHVDLTVTQQVMVVLMSVLAGIGTAGVPGSSLPMIVVVMQSVGVPGAGIGIILGIDRILDMSRTVLNVTGDLTIAACVAGRPRATIEAGVEQVNGEPRISASKNS